MKKRVVSICVTLLISLLAGEATVRLFHSFKPLFIFYDNSYNRFRGKPFAQDFDFRLNASGFKDIAFSAEKNRKFRILGLGDSFAYGAVPYRYTYLTLLESQLQAEGDDVEILNMGIPAIGPNDYLALLMQEGLNLRPDMVLLSFFIGNDIADSIRKKKWYEYSYLTSLLHYLVKISQKYEGRIVHGAGQYCDACPTFTQDAYLRIEKERSGIYLTDRHDIIPFFDNTVDILAKMQHICEKQRIAFVVVLIPDEVQINAQLQKDVRAQLAVQEGGWNTILPNERLAAGLKKQGIDVIDLYPVFAEQSQKKSLYRLRDTHWNIAGNQVAADALQKQVHAYIH